MLVMLAIVWSIATALPAERGFAGALVRLGVLALAGASAYVGSLFALWLLAGAPQGAGSRVLEFLRPALRLGRTRAVQRR